MKVLGSFRSFAAICFAVSVLVFAGLHSPASANMQVSPLIIDMRSAPGANGTFFVNNFAVDELPVEIIVVRRVVAPDGSTELVPADDAFVVFPPQTVIQPKQSQSFRFQYLAPENPGVSSSYYFQVTQIPVELDDLETDESSIRARITFLYQYGVSVNLIPNGAEPRLVVTNTLRKTLANGAQGVALTIENQGNRFGRINEHELTLQVGNATQVFGPDLLEDGLGSGMWLPGQRFEIDFPLPPNSFGSVSATFRYVGE